jgi:predicted transglutaminase-like cysteine proteinase
MTRLLTKALLMAALAAVSCESHAAGLSGVTRGLPSVKPLNAMKEGRPTLAPFAQIRFCISKPTECDVAVGADSVAANSATLDTLRKVNNRINHLIIPRIDAAGDDDWESNVTSGDCEDFALTKRAELVAAGVSPRALRLAIAKTPSGEGHAVLVVKTSKGDLVLDNRTDAIKNWRATDLSWIKIQSGNNPQLWYEL